MRLKLAEDISLPLDAVTQTFLVVGKRGSGKSNTAARFVEQLHHARLPFVVLDPVDTWWGLKASRDGSKGLDVYVFGGRKADLPLEAGAGALIADVLCEHRLSMVLSVKHLSGLERSKFMVAFAQTLFQKWGGGPLHVVLEEAHELAPQNTQNAKEGEQQMLGAFKRLWKLGRSSGIGGTAVTQRPASLSKDITTQSEILIAHRTIGPQDVKAVGEWVKYHGEHLDILADLPALPTGEAFVWAPEFPEGKPIGLKRTAVLLRDTYDSASTPKVGEKHVEPKELAAVDLERLRAKMAATIEKAKADDPRELRRQLAAARAELAKAQQVSQSSKIQRQASTVPGAPILTDADRELLAKIGRSIEEMAAELCARSGAFIANLEQRLNAVVTAALTDYHEKGEKIHEQGRQRFAQLLESKGFEKILGKLAAAPAPLQTTHREGLGVRVATLAATPRPVVQAERTDSLPPGEHAVLTAALQYPGLDRKRLGILTGYKRSSRDAYIFRLAQKGLAIADGTALYPTEAGRAALNGSFVPLPTGRDLVEYWRQRLPEGERHTLNALLAVRGEVERSMIDEVTGYKRSSRDAYLSRLKARGLVEFTARGTVRASEELLS